MSIVHGRPYVVHVTKNGKQNWQLYYVDPVTEKRLWRSTGTTNRRDAERAAARWEADLAAGIAANRHAIPWDVAREAFEAAHLAGKSRHTAAAYRTALNALEDRINPARAASVTSSAILDLVASLRQDQLSETTIATYCRHLRTWARWANRHGYLPSAPVFPAIRSSSARSRPITTEEFERILDCVSRHEKTRNHAGAWRTDLSSLWLSGLRLAESLIVSWDPSADFAIVRHRDGRLYFQIHDSAQKSRRSQLLPLAPDFAAHLRKQPSSGLVFAWTGRNGRIQTPNALGRIIAALGRCAGVVTDPRKKKHATAHDFRRSFGTRWSRVVAPAVLRQMMRHGQIQTTMDYYVDLDARDLADEIYAASNGENRRFDGIDGLAQR